MLFVSTAAAAEGDEPICADRPGKANPSCTVPAGMIQVETGLVDWTSDRWQGSRSDEVDIAATAVKFGLSDRLHIEFDLPAYTHVRTRFGPLKATEDGLGDAGIAAKYRFTDAEAPVQAALYPFMKLPTANHALGNGKVEGGLAVLVDSTFSGSSIGWNIAPEADIVADGDGSGYHLAMVQALSLGVPLSKRLSISGDVWAAWDFDPAGTIRQVSVDAAVAYLVSGNVQVDSGINLGLTQETPDLEIYSGIALRF